MSKNIIYVEHLVSSLWFFMPRKSKSKKGCKANRELQKKVLAKTAEEDSEKALTTSIQELATVCRLIKNRGEQMGATCLAMFSTIEGLKDAEKKWAILEESSRKFAIDLSKLAVKNMKTKGRTDIMMAQILFLTSLRMFGTFLSEDLVGILEEYARKTKEKQNIHELGYAR